VVDPWNLGVCFFFLPFLSFLTEVPSGSAAASDKSLFVSLAEKVAWRAKFTKSLRHTPRIRGPAKVLLGNGDGQERYKQVGCWWGRGGKAVA
jgi:hypothetical protein